MHKTELRQASLQLSTAILCRKHFNATLGYRRFRESFIGYRGRDQLLVLYSRSVFLSQESGHQSAGLSFRNRAVRFCRLSKRPPLATRRDKTYAESSRSPGPAPGTFLIDNFLLNFSIVRSVDRVTIPTGIF